MPLSNEAPRRVESALRREEMLQRRADGLTFKAIAAEFGISIRRARAIVKEEFARVNEARLDRAEAAQDLAVSRLDDLLEAVWEDAMEGDLEAVKTAASIVEKQARVLGLGNTGKAQMVKIKMSLEERAQRLGVSLDRFRPAGLPAPEPVDVEVVEVPRIAEQ